jgi:hypothetical protein
MSYRAAMMASLGAQNWRTDEIDLEVVALFPEFPVSSKSKQTPTSTHSLAYQKIETPPKALEQKSTNVVFNCGLGKVARKKHRGNKHKVNYVLALEGIPEADETTLCLSSEKTAVLFDI